MKFVIAPDKFKGSLTGFEFCNIAEKGILRIFPDAKIIKHPMADGGDGTLEALRHNLQAQRISTTVKNAFYQPIKSNYLYVKTSQTAIIEIAEACGIKRLGTHKLDCAKATTYGVGELIIDAIEKGAKKIILTLGGSATNDAGIGMAEALGFRFKDKHNKTILHPTGKNLCEIHHIEDSNIDPRLQNIQFEAACDVTNPFHGTNGAAYVYAPQKGANEKQILLLDKGLKQFSTLVQDQFSINLQSIPGSGAAGGFGGGACLFLNAKLTPGIELVKSLTHFNQSIKNADWIITGEGKLDNQTSAGKTILGIIQSAKKQNIKVAALCGSIDLDNHSKSKLQLDYTEAISKEEENLKDAFKNAPQNLLQSCIKLCEHIKSTSNKLYLDKK